MGPTTCAGREAGPQSPQNCTPLGCASLTDGRHVDDVPVPQVEGPVLVSRPEDLNQVPGLGVTRVGSTEPLGGCHLHRAGSPRAPLAQRETRCGCLGRAEGICWGAAGQEIIRARHMRAGTGHEMKSTPSCNAMRAKGEATAGCGQLSAPAARPSPGIRAPSCSPRHPQALRKLSQKQPHGAGSAGGWQPPGGLQLQLSRCPAAPRGGLHLPEGPHPAGSPISIFHPPPPSSPGSPLTPSSRPAAAVPRLRPGARLAAEAGPVPWLLPAAINNQQPGRL